MELKNIARRGQAMVFYALVTPLLILFVGGVLDLGWYYLNVSRLQNAADAAALAGAQELVNENSIFNDYYIVALAGNQLPADFDDYKNVFKNTFDNTTIVNGTLNKYKKADNEDLQRTLKEGRILAEEYARKNLSKNLSDDTKVNTNSTETENVTATDDWALENANSEVKGTVELKYKIADGKNDVYGSLYYVVNLKEKIRHLFLPGLGDMDAPVKAVVLLQPHDTDLVTIMQELERSKIVDNWEYANKYKGTTSVYSGKWNHYQAGIRSNSNYGIRYTSGNSNRTESVIVKTSRKTAGKNVIASADGSSGEATNANGGNWYSATEVDSINIDMRAEVKGKFSTDWDIGYDFGETGHSYQFMEGWSATDGSDKRILFNVEFDEPFPTRDTSRQADPLWVRIESDPIKNPYTGAGVANFNSVRQITLNFNSNNTAIENGHYKYRPYFIFYTGPENIDYTRDSNGVLIRHSQPVVLNLNEDLNAVMYFPESPVIINGNEKKWHGFIIAKCYLQAATEKDMTSSGWFWSYDGFNKPSKFRGGYSKGKDGSGQTVYFKDMDNYLLTKSELNAKYLTATQEVDDSTGNIIIKEKLEAPKYILLEYTKADHETYAVIDEDGKLNEAQTFAAYVNATYKEKLKSFYGITDDSQIAAITFPDENNNETTATYYVPLKDKYGDDILLDDDPDPDAKPINDLYVKVKLKDSDTYKYVEKKKLPYVKVRTNKDYFYVCVYDLKLKWKGQNYPHYCADNSGVRMIDNSFTDAQINDSYGTVKDKGIKTKDNEYKNVDDKATCSDADIYVNPNDKWCDSWGIYAKSDSNLFNDYKNNWKKDKLEFESTNENNETVKNEINGVPYFINKKEKSALPKDPQIIAKYHKITLLDSNGEVLKDDEGNEVVKYIKDDDNDDIQYYTQVDTNNDETVANYVIVDKKGNMLTKPLTAPELFTTEEINTKTVNDDFKKKAEALWGRASDALLIDYWKKYTRYPNGTKDTPNESVEPAEIPEDVGFVNEKGQYVGQDQKRKDEDYRIPAFERIYYKSDFNLNEDSYYSYFDFEEKFNKITLKRTNYKYLNVNEINRLLNNEPLADWKVDDMFFTKIRAEWVD